MIPAPQQQGLDNFTVQRDGLQKEVAALLILRDNLTKGNTELNTSNSDLVSQLVDNQLRMKDEIGVANTELDAIKASVLNEQNKLDLIVQRKVEVTADVEKLTALVTGLNDAIAKAKDDTMGVLSNLGTVTTAVNDHLAIVTRSTDNVSQSSEDALKMIESFKGYVVTQEATLAAKGAELDVREIALNARQTAIDETYGGLLKEMADRQIPLSDLNVTP